MWFFSLLLKQTGVTSAEIPFPKPFLTILKLVLTSYVYSQMINLLQIIILLVKRLFKSWYTQFFFFFFWYWCYCLTIEHWTGLFIFNGTIAFMSHTSEWPYYRTSLEYILINDKIINGLCTTISLNLTCFTFFKNKFFFSTFIFFLTF